MGANCPAAFISTSTWLSAQGMTTRESEMRGYRLETAASTEAGNPSVCPECYREGTAGKERKSASSVWTQGRFRGPFPAKVKACGS